jgi:hypothetical protein
MPWLLNLRDIILGPQVSEDSLREKRLTPRVNCFIEASFTTEDNSTFEGNITVLEMTGMRIVTPRKMVKGQKLVISVDSFSGVLMTRPYSVDNVNAEVVWCQKKRGFSQFMAGVKFTDRQEYIQQSWVHFVLDSFGIKESTGIQRRKDIRVQTALPVRCFYGKKGSAVGVAYDISLGGMRMNFKNDIGVGKDVTLEIGPYKRLGILKCRGRIKRSNYHAAQDAFVMGVEFLGLDDKAIRKIGGYIRALLQESSV